MKKLREQIESRFIEIEESIDAVDMEPVTTMSSLMQQTQKLLTNVRKEGEMMALNWVKTRMQILNKEISGHETTTDQ